MSMNPYCMFPGCVHRSTESSHYCVVHTRREQAEKCKTNWGAMTSATIYKSHLLPPNEPVAQFFPATDSMASKYPKYYKVLPANWTSVDTYAINVLFPVDDPSGCILHARKKLLVPGVRSGGKSMRKDIQEARDTLNRWFELNPE